MTKYKINANINKKKGTKVIHIKSHFINIIDTFTIGKGDWGKTKSWVKRKP